MNYKYGLPNGSNSKMQCFCNHNEYFDIEENQVSLNMRHHQCNHVQEQTLRKTEAIIQFQDIFCSELPMGQFQPSSLQIDAFLSNQNEQDNKPKTSNGAKNPENISNCQNIFFESSQNLNKHFFFIETGQSPIQVQAKPKHSLKNKDKKKNSSQVPSHLNQFQTNPLNTKKEPTYQGFLPTSKLMFTIIMQLHQPQLMQNQRFKQFIQKGKTATREDFAIIFDDQELRPAFAKMFKSKYMRSEFNNARIKLKNKKEFLKRMEYLKKCFIQRKVHNLI